MDKQLNMKCVDFNEKYNLFSKFESQKIITGFINCGQSNSRKEI